MITTKIIFDRRKQATRTKDGIVEVRVTVDRKSMYISTGVRVYHNEWAAGRVVNRHDAAVLNDRVGTIYEKVCEAVNESLKIGTRLNIDTLKQAVWQIVEGSKGGPVFLDWVESQIPMLDISDGTRRPLLWRLLTMYCNLSA